MISHNMKKIFAVFMTVALSICMMMFIGLNTANAQSSYDMSIEQGTSIRTSGDIAIRFRTSVKTSEINALIDAGKTVEVVTLITPSRYLGEAELNANFQGSMKEVVFSVANKNLVDNGDYIVPVKGEYNVYNACIYGVQEHNIAQDFSARSYIKVDNEIVQYTETTSGNAWDSAKAYLNENESLSETDPEQFDYISAICAENTVTITGFDGKTKEVAVRRGQSLADSVTMAQIKAELDVEGTAYFTGLDNYDLNAVVTEDMTVNATFNALGFTENGNSYTASLNTFSSADSKVVIVPATYNGKDVTAFDKTNLNGYSGYTHVVFPESITSITSSFEGWYALEYVAMPGVTNYSVHNGFLQCNKMTTLIVGSSFTSSNQVFKYWGGGIPAEAGMTIYTISKTAFAPTIDSRSDMWNGKLVAYSDDADCGTWSWANASKTSISVRPAHDYDAQTGICANCDNFNSYGVSYEYVESTDTYTVTAYDNTVSKSVRVYETYDDGVHGRKSVTSITGKPFNGNLEITALYLPKTITTAPVMEECFKLKVLSMPGVTSVTTSNCFLGCHVLETLIVGEGFTVHTGNGAFYQSWNNGSYVGPLMTIYTTSTSLIAPTFNHANDTAWNGKVVVYSEGAKLCETWGWADETKTSITVNEDKHSFDATTGICKHCNTFNDCGLTYTLNEQGTAYSVTAWDGITPVVKIYPEYKGLPVTAIEGKPFNNSLNALTELYVAETITELPVMEQCFGLKVLAIPGVKTLGEGNHLLGCRSLEALIVGSEFSTTVASALYSSWNYAGYTGPIMTIYTTQATPITPSIAQGEKSTAWNGIVGCYDKNLSAENTWCWADEQQIGISIYTAE